MAIYPRCQICYSILIDNLANLKTTSSKAFEEGLISSSFNSSIQSLTEENQAFLTKQSQLKEVFEGIGIFLWKNDSVHTLRGLAGNDYTGHTYIQSQHIIELQEARQAQEITIGIVESERTSFSTITGDESCYKKHIRELRQSTEKILIAMGLIDDEGEADLESYFNYDENGEVHLTRRYSQVNPNRTEWQRVDRQILSHIGEPYLPQGKPNVYALDLEELRHPLLVGWFEYFTAINPSGEYTTTENERITQYGSSQKHSNILFDLQSVSSNEHIGNTSQTLTIAKPLIYTSSSSASNAPSGPLYSTSAGFSEAVLEYDPDNFLIFSPNPHFKLLPNKKGRLVLENLIQTFDYTITRSSILHSGQFIENSITFYIEFYDDTEQVYFLTYVINGAHNSIQSGATYIASNDVPSKLYSDTGGEYWGESGEDITGPNGNTISKFLYPVWLAPVSGNNTYNFDFYEDLVHYFPETASKNMYFTQRIELSFLSFALVFTGSAEPKSADVSSSLSFTMTNFGY